MQFNGSDKETWANFKVNRLKDQYSEAAESEEQQQNPDWTNDHGKRKVSTVVREESQEVLAESLLKQCFPEYESDTRI